MDGIEVEDLVRKKINRRVDSEYKNRFMELQQAYNILFNTLNVIILENIEMRKIISEKINGN